MQITAQIRKDFGKHTKSLRKQNNIPGVVMEKAQASLPVTLSFIEFAKVYKEAGETSLIDFALGGATYKVLISEVQVHPVSLKPLHVVFRKVDLKEKLTAQVPVEIINEELNALIKSGEAMMLKLLDEIAVEALPGDLPKEFIIDAAKLMAIGDEVTIADLDYDRTKIEISEYDTDEPVAKLGKVEEMQVEEEAAVITEEEAVAKVTATEELTDEEKAKREEEKKAEKGDKK